ncbi:MAG TPA: BatD family protein [Bacteroidota bacterium]|nr:BatD family protein [Bacteroidota bacterium]
MKSITHNIPRLLLAALLCLLVEGRSLAGDVSFSASVDKTTVTLGEQFTLQLMLTGGGMNGGRNLALPPLPKFMILSGPDESSNVQIVNGSVSSSVTYTYTLQPREAGKFTIGSATIELSGNKYSTSPIDITVVKGTSSPKQPAASGGAPDKEVQLGDNLFLRATVDRSRVYLGEQITATFKIYTRVRITNYTINKLPAMSGFWGEDLTIPQQVSLTTESYNGKQYQVGLLKKVALFPTQQGTLEINPFEIVCQVQIENRRRSNDFFDQFFNDPFFNNLTTSNVAVKSAPLKVTVLPLPKNNVPASFKGAVGKFTLNASLSSTHVKTNEPLTLKASVAGTGNIKILEAPNLEVPSEFEKYDPKVNENIDRSGSFVNGSKTFEWLLVPRYPGQKRIAPLEFSYFDPGAGKYVTLRSGAFDLTVDKGSAEPSQVTAGLSKEDVKLLSQDIRFIKTGSVGLRKKGEDVLSLPAAAAITIVPLLAFVGLVAYRQKSLRELSDAALFRSRKAMKIATKRLKDARALLGSQDSEAFYAETSRALWAYVSDRLSIDRSMLSIDNVMKHLEEKRISQEVSARLKETLESCEFARFAPSSATQEEKTKIYDMASNVIVATEKELNR